jgi:hypothetical protein
VMNIMIYVMTVINIMKCILCMWFLVIFIRATKKMQRTLCRAFLGMWVGRSRTFVVRFQAGALQSFNLCSAFSGWRTAKAISRRLQPVSWAAFLPCASPRHTAKIVHRALSETAHDNATLPCKNLSCTLCRAPWRKTHDKDFVGRFLAFAVHPANYGFP